MTVLNTGVVKKKINDSGSRYMTTQAWLDNQTGHIDVRTYTHNAILVTGYTGGVKLVFSDATGRTVGESSSRRFGVDGKWFGRWERTDYWNESIDPGLAARITQVEVVQSWDAKYAAAQNIISRAVQAALPVVELRRQLAGAGV
jgi:hypothetical protein